jgi:hypothetical protein
VTDHLYSVAQQNLTGKKVDSFPDFTTGVSSMNGELFDENFSVA